MDPTTLFLGVLVGSVGMGYVVYGRRQKKGIALLAGLLLCGLPCFVSNWFFLIVASIAVAVVPFCIPY